jgi:hypothetical protein
LFYFEKYDDPFHLIDYLSRTIKGSSIQNKNFDFSNDTISLNDSTEYKSFSQEEFIRRFLLHVLPSGTKSIRYYGLYSVKAKDRLNIAKSILGQSHDTNNTTELQTDLSDENYEFLPYKFCPVCKKRMVLIEKTLPYDTPIYIIDRFGKDPPGPDFFTKIAA